MIMYFCEIDQNTTQFDRFLEKYQNIEPNDPSFRLRFDILIFLGIVIVYMFKKSKRVIQYF